MLWTFVDTFMRCGNGGWLKRLSYSVIFTVAAACIGAADAQSQGLNAVDGAPVRRLQVTRFKSRTFTLRTPFSSAVVGSPEIADVLPISDRVLYVQGKKAGTTNVSVFGLDKKLIGVLDVEVLPDTQAISERIRERHRHSRGIRVSSSHEQIVLTGEAGNSIEAEHALEIAKSVSPDTPVINLMKVAPSQQVLLKVRFLEASRSAERDLGVNLYSANKAGTSGVNTGTSLLNSSTGDGPASVDDHCGADRRVWRFAVRDSNRQAWQCRYSDFRSGREGARA